MAKLGHQRALDILVHRTGQWSWVQLRDGTSCMVYDVAWGYDLGDEVAHVTTNVSPGPQPDDERDFVWAVDFFFADQVVKVVDHGSDAVVFELAGHLPEEGARPFAAARYLGRESVSGRNLYLLEAKEPGQIPSVLDIFSPSFVCFLAWDAESAAAETIERVATRILGAGCAYVCCWGPRCGLVHDAFDEVAMSRGADAPLVMTTWHEGESLSEALWFALFTAQPVDAFAEDCRAVVAFSIGSRQDASKIRAAMRDCEAFNAAVQRSQ